MRGGVVFNESHIAVDLLTDRFENSRASENYFRGGDLVDRRVEC